MQELPLGAVAATYGLLQLPKMPELRNRDVSDFPEITDLDLNAISYRDKTREEQRIKKLTQFTHTGYLVFILWKLIFINHVY